MKKRTVLTWGLVTALALPVGALASKGSDDSKSGSSSSGSGSSASDDSKLDDKGGSTGTSSSSGSSTPTSTSNSSDDNNISDDKGVDSTPDDHGVDSTTDDRGNDSSTSDNSSNSSNANRGDSQASFVKVEVPLAPTSAGSAINAHGHVDIRVQGTKQRIEVEAEADLADGTIVNITLNGVPAGIATFQLGEAEFEFETGGSATLPGGILPSDVTSASVSDSGGNVLLDATFGAIGTGAPTTTSSSSTLVSKKINLTPTADAPNGSKAVSELRVRTGDARFKVQVEANVADGTVYNVSANGIQVGSITMKLHRGELQLEQSSPLPAGLTTLADIATVSVSNTGGAVLFTGTF